MSLERILVYSAMVVGLLLGWFVVGAAIGGSSKMVISILLGSVFGLGVLVALNGSSSKGA